MNNIPEPVPAENLPDNETPSARRVPPWTWVALTAVVALPIGLILGNVTKAPEVQTVEKEVTKTVTVEKVPQVCHEALLAYESYGKNMDSVAYTYREFINTLQAELNGSPSPRSDYEALGMTIGLSQSLADEQAVLLDSLLPECNKVL